jgi:tetratricopeptide (TPR) repeat protein
MKISNLAKLVIPLIATFAVGISNPLVLKPIKPQISNSQIQITKPPQENKNNDNLNANTIHQIIDSKINSAFSNTINLINVLLFVLTLFIGSTSVYAWLIMRGIITGILTEIKKQVEEEVRTQMKQEVNEEIDEHITRIRDKIQYEITEIENFTKQQRNNLASKIGSEISNVKSIINSEVTRLKSIISSNEYINQGNYYFVSTNYENALIYYEKAIEIEPGYPEAWFYKGRTLSLGEKRYEEAIVAYKQAIKLKIDYYEAMIFCSVALRKLKRYEESISMCDKAIEVNPNYPRAWYSRACSYALLGNVEQAIKNLEKSIEISNRRYREVAKTDLDFEDIRDNEEFTKLVYGDEKVKECGE